ncbi:uncharacterized protein [Parasteatoda tepidariorum]|uniref:uncharacterized protein isoform X2 n=1 Tax=Parasteatoda tepidariorum TaxID=114398 RepID=UPI00077F9801|nr:uncharacterized protein LOC107437127 isoform X2 [Parasteatoda tepidariorum]
MAKSGKMTADPCGGKCQPRGGACAEVRDRSKTRGRQIQLVNDAVYKSRSTEGSTDCKEPFFLPRNSILLEAIMLVLLFLLSTWSEMCHSQIVYMPRYVVRPVRRSAMEALERLRLPVTRYFPQVDTQAVPYQSGPTFMTGDVPPNQWVDDYAPAEDEEGDYINYEYRDYRPPTQYGEEVYAQEPSDVYNNLMDRYLMEQPKEDMFDVPRRRNEDHLPEPQNATTAAPTQKVQMTAVPPAPEKKDMKSLVVPDQRAEEREEDVSGQKEEPLFRPLQSSQKTKWNNNKATQKKLNRM